MVMVKCPQTGHASPTGIKTDRESFPQSPAFFARTRCLICHTDHSWFAREARFACEPGVAREPGVDEPSARALRRSAGSLA